MNYELMIFILLCFVSALSVALLIIMLVKKSATDMSGIYELKSDIVEEQRASRKELTDTTRASVMNMGELLSDAQKRATDMQDRRLSELIQLLAERQKQLQDAVLRMMEQSDTRIKVFSERTELKLEGVRATMENRLTAIQEDNNKKLEKMRETVDEKLQKTLEERLGQSFRLVSERLEEVNRGLGRMQELASGVGDLKKVLSNVKTRGILGEIQLGAILDQILAPEQYVANYAPDKAGRNVVEYAVKLPAEGDDSVYLPIDAKFPADLYESLVDAYDSGDTAAIEAAAKLLDSRIKQCAKDIHDKYINPPSTTDFAIMFLPTEGLYAEVVRRGLIETLQREYHVNIAGPTTMSALLNSLQMGFRTLAIQKSTSQVWDMLASVRTEFDKFGGVLASAQKKISQANDDLDRLVGARTRAIQRRLRNVSAIAGDAGEPLAELTDESETED